MNRSIFGGSLGKNGNLGGMIQQFQNFKNMMKNKNPQEMLNSALSSGRYTQDDINRARDMANMFANILK